MTRRSLFVGRSRSNDIRPAHRSVSRRHAELTVADNGRIYLTDCASRYGTRVRSGTRWREIRQDFVNLDDIVRLGDCEISVRELLARESPSPSTTRGHVEETRPSGPVARNPRTGEVVRKRS